MAQPRYDFAAVAIALKRALRKKNLSYRELGDAIGMSESGIKKVMTGEDVSMARLAAMCDAAGLDLLELLSAAWSGPQAPVTFTPEQEALFEAEPACHDFFRALLDHDFDVDAIAREYDLDRRSVDHYVGRLEDADFVHVTAEGRVKPSFDGSGWMRYRSPDSDRRLVDALTAALAQDRDKRCIRNGRVRMTARHLDEFNREILDLLLRYQVISTQDELYVDDDQLVSVWVLAATAHQKLRDVMSIPRVAARG